MAASESVNAGLHAVQRCAGDTPHRMIVKGYAVSRMVPGLDCERPLEAQCRSCDYRTAWACGGHRASRCKPCAGRYRRRVREVAVSGTARAEGLVGMLTLTAPGDRAHRLPDRSWCPCTPRGGVDLAQWNASHSARWNHLRTLLRREYPDVQFFRAIEVQQRGALHDHAILRIPNVALISLTRVRALAIRAGFGHSVDFAPCKPGSQQFAYYVSKYVTKATDAREDVPWRAQVVDVATGEISMALVPGRYRTWSMSRKWGSTMAHVRAQGAAYAAVKRAAEGAAEEVRVAGVLLAGLGAVTPLPAAASP